MSVKLRKRILKNGNESYYLDIYHNGQRKFEFLGIEVDPTKLTSKKSDKEKLGNPIDNKKEKLVNPIEIKTNQDNLKLANQIRANREAELLNGKYKFVSTFVEKTDFFVWANQYTTNRYNGSTLRDYTAVLEHFKKHTGLSVLQMKSIDKQLITDFKEYLFNDSGLSYSTPYQYFAKFKTIIKVAIEKSLLDSNLLNGIKNESVKAKSKVWLNFDDIQLLENTECKTPDIKNAFLFSCNTGLRHIDLFNLTWNDIDLAANTLTIKQQKTGEPLIINLNNNALHYIGEKQNHDKKVFPGLRNISTDNEKLSTWVKKAGINKHVTFHVSRHSFATNCLYYGSDALTVAKLLGHTSLKYVAVYVKIVESLKSKAVNNLPETKKSGK